MTPSLASTWPTCVLTVFSEIPSSSAIRLFERPRAISARTSRSRPVRLIEHGPVAGGGRRSFRERVHEPRGDGRIDDRLAGVGGPHRPRELGGLGVLEQVAGGSGLERGQQPVVLEEAREHDHAAAGRALA